MTTYESISQDSSIAVLILCHSCLPRHSVQRCISARVSGRRQPRHDTSPTGLADLLLACFFTYFLYILSRPLPSESRVSLSHHLHQTGQPSRSPPAIRRLKTTFAPRALCSTDPVSQPRTTTCHPPIFSISPPAQLQNGRGRRELLIRDLGCGNHRRLAHTDVLPATARSFSAPGRGSLYESAMKGVVLAFGRPRPQLCVALLV